MINKNEMLEMEKLFMVEKGLDFTFYLTWKFDKIL